MSKLWIALAAALFAGLLWPAESDLAVRGRDLFQRRCTGCHGLDNAKVGPALRGVFGRRSASGSGFPYSDALKKAHVVWNEATLDHWLTDPDAVAPDNDMAFRLDDAAERTAIIEYLKQLSSKRDIR